LAALLLAGPACVYTTLWDVHEDLTNKSRDPIDFQVTTAVGVHFIVEMLPLFGDGTLDNALTHFQDAARGFDAQGLRIAETGTTVYWWVLPPITFLFPVVVTRVTGDIQYVPAPSAMAAPEV
jgi:hypothetical protein